MKLDIIYFDKFYSAENLHSLVIIASNSLPAKMFLHLKAVKTIGI